MMAGEQMFFNTEPLALPLYEAMRDKLLARCPDAGLRVQKPQITFRASPMTLH